MSWITVLCAFYAKAARCSCLLHQHSISMRVIDVFFIKAKFSQDLDDQLVVIDFPSWHTTCLHSCCHENKTYQGRDVVLIADYGKRHSSDKFIEH